MCALWTDSDVNPNDPTKYATIEDAISDILAFCMLLEIPPPSIIIASGTGVHCYWLSDRTLTPEIWQTYADALKIAAQNSLLKIDAGVTGDAARVLRLPGTLNHKYNPPRPVKFVKNFCNFAKHDFSVVLTKLLAVVPLDPKRDKRQFEIPEAFKGLDPNANLGVGIEIREVGPLPIQPILDGCAWLREAAETGGKNYDQSQWNLTTLCAVFLEDGHEWAHKLGNQHPKYVPAETDEIWERKNWEHRTKNVGWPSCRAIHDARSIHCRTCPHFKQGKSPLNLGYVIAKAAKQANEEDQELKLLGGARPVELRLPEGYAIDEKGRICTVNYSKQVKGKGLIPGYLTLLIRSKLQAPSFQCKDGRYGLGFTAETEIGKSAEVFLTLSDCAESSLFKHLGEKFVLYVPNKKIKEMTVGFMVSWLDKLRLEDQPVHDSSYMGWRYVDGKRVGFIYGGKIYNNDGTEALSRTVGDDEFRRWYKPMGTREAWLQAAKLITNRKRPELQVIVAVAFAAPLMAFAGSLYGAILSVWGHPGTSKSTAQMIAAAVWGHPKQTRESLNSTPKSVQGRLGRTRNLPAYWDDVQDERHQQALFDTMFVASEGAEGGRLNIDTSMRTRLEWQTLMVACSNASFVDFLVKKQTSTTAGMRRVFEIPFDKSQLEQGMIDPVDASIVFAKLEHNYGVIGAEYARMLATEHTEIEALVINLIQRFGKRVRGTPDEYYWWGTAGALLAGAALATRLGVEFDLPTLEKFLVRMFFHNREIRAIEGTEGGTFEHTAHALAGFINSHIQGNTLWTAKLFTHHSISVEGIYTPSPPGRPIYIQIARDDRTIIFSKRMLRKYLEDNDISVRQVFVGLREFFRAKESKLTVGAGTVMAQVQENCFAIERADKFAILADLLVAHGPPKT